MRDGLRTYDGSVAIVTGAGSGIGRALAGELAARGSHVVLADIDLADVEAVAAQVRDKGGRASARRVDVSNFPEVESLVAGTLQETGRLDYLFNNAGIVIVGEAADHTIEMWNRIIAVNISGVANGVQAAYPRMIRQGFGHIVNTASMAGLITSPVIASYAATKHAVVGLSKALRVEAASHGVRVSVLCPGAINTPILDGGKHGQVLVGSSEQAGREFLRERAARFRPMDPARFAGKALDAVASNRAIIIVPAWWKPGWWIERVSPALNFFLAGKFLQRLRRLLAAEAA